jgi:hypothetical protein
MFTITAFIAIQGILKDGISHSFYNYLLAARAVSTFARMAWYVAGIRKVQA